MLLWFYIHHHITFTDWWRTSCSQIASRFCPVSQLDCRYVSKYKKSFSKAPHTRSCRVLCSFASRKRCPFSCRLNSPWVMSRDHSFLRAAEFRAEPRNLAVAAEFPCFRGISRNSRKFRGTTKFCNSVIAVVIVIVTRSPFTDSYRGLSISVTCFDIHFADSLAYCAVFYKQSSQ